MDKMFQHSKPFYLKLIVACRLHVIYVRKDIDSNVQAMIMWITWTLLSASRERPLNLITNSLTLMQGEQVYVVVSDYSL